MSVSGVSPDPDIHGFLEPAVVWLSLGGRITVVREGLVMGPARTVEDLYRLATSALTEEGPPRASLPADAPFPYRRAL